MDSELIWEILKFPYWESGAAGATWFKSGKAFNSCKASLSQVKLVKNSQFNSQIQAVLLWKSGNGSSPLTLNLGISIISWIIPESINIFRCYLLHCTQMVMWLITYRAYSFSHMISYIPHHPMRKSHQIQKHIYTRGNTDRLNDFIKINIFHL